MAKHNPYKYCRNPKDYQDMEEALDQQEAAEIKVFLKFNNNDLKELPQIWRFVFGFLFIFTTVILIAFDKNPKFIKAHPIEIITSFVLIFLIAAIPTFKALLTKRKLIHRLEKLENKKFQTTSTAKIIKFRPK
ncbi:MAG: hypothetical protein PHD49_02660 [Candidatus Shapirobacteria bacterium]|nr:hypothetical protein [Candidatus Shapirobacteria bacterium]